ncbi:MAG: histidinol-phosphate aminotransferase family protein [Clostridia bacterium]|nr:histidinol-phosphate aminotransferase family protein [Clostridia bacterium]
MKHGGNVWEGGNPGRWLDFSANLRPEGPPEWVQKTLRRALDDVRYYPDRSMKAARAGLAAYAGIPEQNLLPTAGGEAAIDLALTLRQGPVYADKVTFGGYAQRAAARGRPMASGIQEATVFLCNPNNPTGAAQPRKAVLALHQAAVASRGELIVDEAFIDYCPQHSLRGAVCDTLSVVGSLTKILGIPGVRLGYIAASPQHILRLQSRMPAWPLSALAVAVAAELPGHLDEIKQDAALNAERRADFAERLSDLGALCETSQASFLLCDFGRDMTAAAAELKRRGILVRTCASFGLGGNYLRLAVKTEEQNERFIKELKQCLAY